MMGVKKIADIRAFESLQGSDSREVSVHNWRPSDGTQTNLKISFDLSGPEGNIFAVIGKCESAMRRAGVDKDFIGEFRKAVTSSGSYAKALIVVSDYVDADFRGFDDDDDDDDDEYDYDE